MPWAEEGSKTSVKLRELADRVRVEVGGADELQHENGGAASEGFINGCDAYDAFMFTATIDGRTYCVTVEDVTIA